MLFGSPVKPVKLLSAFKFKDFSRKNKIKKGQNILPFPFKSAFANQIQVYEKNLQCKYRCFLY
jgi:hypothetical protein